MKKILLSVLIIVLGLPVLSQKRIKISKEKSNITKTTSIFVVDNGDELVTKPANPFVSNQDGAKYGNEIGITKYDLQSAAALANRIWLFDDGTASAVWTMGFEDDDFPDRGTGYNYFDGTQWGDEPTTRIEDDRCGWPSIAAWGENGEIIVSHTSYQIWQDDELVINKRAAKGTGDWTQILLPGPEYYGPDIHWPRMTTSGPDHNYIHIIIPAGSAIAGQDKPLLYTRSDDGGETWTDWMILDEINSDYYKGFGPDEYTWAESRGDVIAFTIANPWHDWIVMKSTDNGENWEKIVIWEHPYPMFDFQTTITTDTIWAPDNSVDIALDNEGMVHAVCGLTRVMHTEPGYSATFFPWTDGIIYWNETMPPFTAENQHRALAYENLVEDETLIGWVVDNGTPLLGEICTYRELGMSTMPNITCDDGQIVVVWSSVTAGYENGQYNFRHIWTRRSFNNGNPNSWGNMTDLDTDINHWFDECIYPVLAGSFDAGGTPYIIYNIDPTPGTAFDGDHDYQTNSIFFEGPNFCQNPNIWVHPYSFTIIKPSKGIDNNEWTGSYLFTIGNSGDAVLKVYSVTGTKPWITGLGSDSKLLINPGDSVVFSFDIDWSQIIYGSDTAEILIHSNDPWNWSVDISITAFINEAFLYTDISEIDLGTQGPVYPFDTVFTIKNTGIDTLTGVLSEDLSWISSLTPTSFNLATYHEQEITVSGIFPNEIGEFSGLININSNGGDTNILVYGNVTGQGVLLVNPTIFDLGNDTVGAIFSKSFTVNNNGTEFLSGNIYENTEWITSVVPDTISLDAGEEITVSFEGYFPEESGPFSTNINILTSAGQQYVFISGIADNVYIPENSQPDFTVIVYPNPSLGKVSFKTNLPKNEKPAISVYNYFGVKLSSTNYESENGVINLSEYGNGVYFIKFKFKEKTVIRRVCIVK